jgi:2-polyprenyl-6-methoxyphenol hydroxylase-like FAD-dependent oxidoreductase
MDSDVLTVGAGPTGLTLAIDLGKRGGRCTLCSTCPIASPATFTDTM